MDIETFVTLALLLLYLFIQLVGGRKKQQRRSPERPLPPRERDDAPRQAPSPSAEWEDALREIRIALGGAEPEEPPVQQVPPARQAEPVPPSRLERTPPSPPPEFHAPATRYDEEAFEQRPAFQARPAPAEKRSLPPGPIQKSDLASDALAFYEEPAAGKKRAAAPLLKRLKNSQTAREAIILSEILGPPRARR